MADTQTVIAAIRSDFDSRFGAAESTVQILHDNEQPLGQKSGTTNPDEAPESAEWVRVFVRPAQAEIREIGGSSAHLEGRLVVQIHVGLAQGDDGAWRIFDSVRDLYQGQAAAGAHFYATEAILIGATADNRWWALQASTRFYFDS